MQAMVNQAGTVIQLHSWSDIFGLENRCGWPAVLRANSTFNHVLRHRQLLPMLLSNHAGGQAVKCSLRRRGSYHPPLYQLATVKDLGLGQRNGDQSTKSRHYG